MASGFKKVRDHMFSIQLKSKEHLKNMSIVNDDEDNILIEGFFGHLESISFVEGMMLEVKGANGSLRMDFTEEELRRLLSARAMPMRRSEETENKRA